MTLLTRQTAGSGGGCTTCWRSVLCLGLGLIGVCIGMRWRGWWLVSRLRRWLGIRDVGCRRGTVSQWCREAGVVLVRGRQGGSFEADRARRARVVQAVLGRAGLPEAAAAAGVCRQSASRYWHDQTMETASAASARFSGRCSHSLPGSACSGRVGRGQRLSDAERVLIAQGRARGKSTATIAWSWAGAVRPSLGRSPVAERVQWFV